MRFVRSIYYIVVNCIVWQYGSIFLLDVFVKLKQECILVIKDNRKTSLKCSSCFLVFDVDCGLFYYTVITTADKIDLNTKRIFLLV